MRIAPNKMQLLNAMSFTRALIVEMVRFEQVLTLYETGWMRSPRELDVMYLSHARGMKLTPDIPLSYQSDMNEE